SSPTVQLSPTQLPAADTRQTSPWKSTPRTGIPASPPEMRSSSTATHPPPQLRRSGPHTTERVRRSCCHRRQDSLSEQRRDRVADLLELFPLRPLPRKVGGERLKGGGFGLGDGAELRRVGHPFRARWMRAATVRADRIARVRHGSRDTLGRRTAIPLLLCDESGAVVVMPECRRRRG